MRQSRRHEGFKQRMSSTRIGRELGMELHAKEERMVGQLHHLGEIFARRAGRDHHALGLELRHIGIVHLIAVTMALAHDRAVDLVGQSAGLHGHFLLAEPERAAHVARGIALFNAAGVILPLGDERHNGVRRVQVKLGGVGAAQAADVPGKFDDGGLHPEADAQVRNLVHAGVLDRLDHALGAALAKAARNHQPCRS